MGSPLVQGCPIKCASICAEKARVKMFQEEQALAAVVYEDRSSFPDGKRVVRAPDGSVMWEEVPDDELLALGIDPAELEPEGSGFRAAVMRRPGSNDIHVSYQGTVSWFSEGFLIPFSGGFLTPGEDMQNNWQQSQGQTSQHYSRAQEIAKRLKNGAKPGQNVKFVGHSLGGGLASAAANATGLPATTFNAAGLHDINLRPDNAQYDAPAIDAVRVDGEFLTALQGVGERLGLAPEAAGSPYPIRPAAGLSRLLDGAKYGALASLVTGVGGLLFGGAAVARSGYLHTNAALENAIASRLNDLEHERTNQPGCQC